ncbi:hypothetical protein SLEX105133_00070 [Slackia exigua]|nr:Uncharacterised protein [Slackia exigua]
MPMVAMLMRAMPETSASATRRATITLAALPGYEYFSSATPCSLLACTVGTPTNGTNHSDVLFVLISDIGVA